MSDGSLQLDRSAVEAREVDGELVVYDMRRRTYLGGNRTAARLWPLLLDGTDLPALAAALAAEWDLPLDQARTDAEAFVASLREHGLLVEPGT